MSSDSDDDYYGNIAQKLERMKNAYEGTKNTDKIQFDDSAELDSLVANTVLNAERASPTLEDIAGPSVSSNIAVLPEADARKKSKRSTRSTAKNRNSDDDEDYIAMPAPPPTKRKKGTRSWRQTAMPQSNTPNTRMRGRGRNRRHVSIAAAILPTYSIGDAEYVPDLSENQALFSNPTHNDDVVVIEEIDTDPLDDNEELSVKVYWQSCEFFRFTIRRYQKLSQIFDYFSEKQKVDHNKLLFTYNERILNPNDTPESINYSIVKFIEGGIVNQSVMQVTHKRARMSDGVKIKFQCQNVKKPFELAIKLDDKLSVAMMKCAEHFETPLNRLRFQFDGDSISGKNTARDLELEGGECIDVKVIG